MLKQHQAMALALRRGRLDEVIDELRGAIPRQEKPASEAPPGKESSLSDLGQLASGLRPDLLRSAVPPKPPAATSVHAPPPARIPEVQISEGLYPSDRPAPDTMTSLRAPPPTAEAKRRISEVPSASDRPPSDTMTSLRASPPAAETQEQVAIRQPRRRRGRAAAAALQPPETPRALIRVVRKEGKSVPGSASSRPGASHGRGPGSTISRSKPPSAHCSADGSAASQGSGKVAKRRSKAPSRRPGSKPSPAAAGSATTPATSRSAPVDPRTGGSAPPSSRKPGGRPSPRLAVDPAGGSLFGASRTYGLDDAILEYLTANAKGATSKGE